jgi:hypothetical protein
VAGTDGEAAGVVSAEFRSHPEMLVSVYRVAIRLINEADAFTRHGAFLGLRRHFGGYSAEEVEGALDVLIAAGDLLRVEAEGATFYVAGPKFPHFDRIES